MCTSTFVTPWSGTGGLRSHPCSRLGAARRSTLRFASKLSVHMGVSAAPSSNRSILRYGEGLHFNQAVVHNRVVYLAGQVPREAKGTSLKEQTGQVLHKIDELLEAAGTDKGHVIYASVWLKDIKSGIADFNEVWDEWLDGANKPARAAVEANMVQPEWLVEIAVTAAQPSRAAVVQTDRAAAAVGPYNQAIRLEDGMVYVSGCIGLGATSGALVSEELEEQTSQALNNMREILTAAGSSPSQVVKTTILLEDISDFARVNELYKQFFGDGGVPARSTFAVKALPKGAKVEIECVATSS